MVLQALFVATLVCSQSCPECREMQSQLVVLRGLSVPRSLEDSRKRYIASGKDSFKILCQSQVDAPQGGRRFIATRDSLQNGAILKEDTQDRGFVPMRKPGYAATQTGNRLW